MEKRWSDFGDMEKRWICSDFGDHMEKRWTCSDFGDHMEKQWICSDFGDHVEKQWTCSDFGDHVASKHGLGALHWLSWRECDPVFSRALWYCSCRVNDVALGKRESNSLL
ncbi:hypothetical protein DUI87_14281 [Hirundo rustica rustica]|uniref:Uncharacterized protein n=1 Tax=Hirundo rustica rustica TaxID=333673 RepID=A0A3M0K7V4_HIRRU|nr:hypothetical protein DUI87_14281 [Hirundo rustica rustica]